MLPLDCIHITYDTSLWSQSDHLYFTFRESSPHEEIGSQWMAPLSCCVISSRATGKEVAPDTDTGLNIMKKIVTIIVAAGISIGTVSAHDMSAVCPSGQTLYYNIINGHAEVVRPSGPNSDNYVAGHVVIPENVVYNGTSYPVTRIANSAFHGCYSSLHSVVIPNTVTYIGESAFFQCEYLETVTFGNSVDTIARQAFIYCYSLNSIALPASINYIGTSAFSHCNSVSSIVCRASNPPELSYGYDALNEIPVHIPVYIPCGTDSVYHTAYGWSSFTNYHEIQYLFTVSSDNPQWGSVQVITSPNCQNSTAEFQAIPNSGYHFVSWNDGNTEIHRIVEITQDTTFIAFFDVDECDPITSFPWNNSFDENLSCWKPIDADGDSYTWTYYDGAVVSESYAYFDGSNRALDPDNWLISQQIELPATGNYILSWMAQPLNNDYYTEHYSVYLSSTGRDPSDFTTQLYTETLNSANAVNRSINLQNYRGQTIRIAFRHHNSANIFILALGAIKIVQSTQDIDDVVGNTIKAYANNGNIIVEGADSKEVNIYDILGQKVDGGQKQLFKVPNSGVYVVKVGYAPAQRVVVIK